jgi:hypothetical protein
MKKDGFTHMLEWTNVTSLIKSPNSRNQFYAIQRAASEIFGNSWSRYFNNTAKWASVSNVSRIPPRIYFKSEKYISLVLMAAEVPA